MQLVHFSRSPLLRKIDSASNAGEIGFKPKGFWVSDESPDSEMSWSSWCRSEEYGLKNLVYAFEVKVDPASILHLKSAADLDAFTASFGVPTLGILPGSFRYYLNWSKVASLYKGIIITPYIWERRLDDKTLWYYTWDCASGCIWDASAVLSVSPLPQEDREESRAA